MLKGSFICRSDSSLDNPGVSALFPFVPAGGRLCAGCALRAVLKAALTAFLWTALALPCARATDRPDHEQARAAVRAGQVLPLPTLLERLQRTHPGKVLELELERDRGRWIYEVKLLRTDGQLLKLELDAGTGQVLDVRRREDRHPDRRVDSSKEPAK